MNPIIWIAAAIAAWIAYSRRPGAPTSPTTPGGGGTPTTPTAPTTPTVPSAPVVAATWQAGFANGWWPKVTTYDGKVGIACGAFGESWLVELSANLQLLRQHMIVNEAPGGLWRHPHELLIWHVGGTPFEILSINAAAADWNPAKILDTAGGTELGARDGHFVEWLPGQPNRLDTSPVTYASVDGIPVHNYGPADIGRQGWIAHSINDNSLLVRSKAGANPRVITPRVPLLGIRCGPNGEVAYSGGGHVWGWAADGSEVELTVAPWGNEGGQYVWTGRDGATWVLSSCWHASGAVMLLMRPWGSRTAIVIPFGADFATAVEVPGATIVAASNAGQLTAIKIPHGAQLATVTEPGMSATIPVSASFNSPRWFGMFFDRQDARYPTEPAPDTTCAILNSVPSVSPTPGPTTWGWEFFTRNGPAKKVISDIRCAPGVPNEYLLGVYWGLEGGPSFWSNEEHDDLIAHQQYAAQRGVPLIVYMDGGYWSDDANGWADSFLRPQDVPLCMCYPHRAFGPSDAFSWEGLDLARDANNWRLQLQRREGKHSRLAIVRSMYTQTWNYPPAFIESLQPTITALGNDFHVWLDLGFAWARPSGVLQPWGSAPSIRPILEPWVKALGAASRASGIS